MPKQNVPIITFNRGLISKKALARTDIDRVSRSAETMVNWLPDQLGSMSLRPGLQYIDNTLNNAEVLTAIPFIFSSDDKAIIEFILTEGSGDLGRMQVRVNEAYITRPTVTAAITNGTFDSNLMGWTDSDESGATSAWATGGYMSLTGTGFNFAIREQTLTVNQVGTEHALSIHVTRGPVVIRVGSSSGGDQFISETTLATGYHSLAFTPTGNAYIQLKSREQYASLIDYIIVESAGEMSIPTSIENLEDIRYHQSNNVVFIACDGNIQHRIERYGTRSWSLVKYEPEDGPFGLINISSTRLTPSGINGDITLTSSANYFDSGHVGALFKLASIGQNVEIDVTAEDQFSTEIRVIGTGTQRRISITRAGTWTATVTLQRSVDEPGAWVDVATYTSNGTTNYTDGLDNQIIYYRVGVKTGDFTSGTAELSMEYAAGSITGIVKVTAFTDAQTVSARVLTPLGTTDSTADWTEGLWSDYKGFPSAVLIEEGRLWWSGKGSFIGSSSDAFSTFDEDLEGDSAPINKSLGSGATDKVNWMLSLQRILIGTYTSEKSARSSSFDEPLTQDTCVVKDASTQGSASIDAIKIDTRGIYVQAGGTRVYETAYNSGGGLTSFDFNSGDLTLFVPEVCEPGIVQIMVQRQPRTRVHCILSDGTVAILLTDPRDETQCWFKYTTPGASGFVEKGIILPDAIEDAVYYYVRRTIDGSTVRYLEKFAMESQCVGGALNRQADSFLVYDSTSTSTITGLDHLEGEDVVVWGDGADLGTYTVASGSITLSQAVEQAVVGLTYTAQWKSTKLAYAAGLGTALLQQKKVTGLGALLMNTHYQGLEYGPDFDNLDSLPLVADGAVTDADTVWEEFDSDSFEFDGEYDTDSRICLQATAPKPCTVVALVATIQTNDKG